MFWPARTNMEGPVAGGVLIYTHIGGYGFEPRHARPFLFAGFWCFGAQDAPVAGGVLIYTHIGGYGFEPRHARPFLFVGFWCFGAQDATRANRRAVRGCTGKSREFRGWPRFAIFFCDFSRCAFCGLWRSASAEVKNMGFGRVAPAGPQNGL